MFKDGVYQGEGTLKFNNDLCTYSGNFSNGKF